MVALNCYNVHLYKLVHVLNICVHVLYYKRFIVDKYEDVTIFLQWLHVQNISPLLSFILSTLFSAFDHVTIVNKDTLDKEFDNNIYLKNLVQPTSYLNAGYGTLYEHIGTVYQNVHTHYLIVGTKIPTHKDIPVSPRMLLEVVF